MEIRRAVVGAALGGAGIGDHLISTIEEGLVHASLPFGDRAKGILQIHRDLISIVLEVLELDVALTRELTFERSNSIDEPSDKRAMLS